MRWILACLSSAVLAVSAAADVSFVRVWPQWRTEASFDRIGEYFGNPEDAGQEVVLRTHPEEREGLYYLVRVKSDVAVPNARFVLEIIRPDSPNPKQFSFPVSVAAKGGVFQLGLTDGDWPEGREANPVAWRLTLLDGSGQALASQQSFLWARPER